MKKTKVAPKKGRPKGKESTGRLDEFFETLFYKTKGYVEIRTIKKGKVKQYFYSDLDRLTKDLKADTPEFKATNVYFGVCPREDRKGKEENVKEVACLWIDLDCKDDKERIERLRKLKAFNLRPSIIVSSGRGYHVYWLLDKVFAIKDRTEKLTIKGYVKGLSRVLGGDHTFDLARVLRVPGTTNLKDPKNPLPVELSEFYPERSFKLEDFKPYWTEVKETIESDITIGAIPDKFWVLAREDPKVKATWEGKREYLKDKSRSGYDMALANLLIINNFTDNEAASILRKSPMGRGKDASLRYLNRTIGEARRAWDKRKEEPMQDEKFDRIKEFDWKGEKWISDKMRAIAKEVFATEKAKTGKENKQKKGVKTLIPGLIHLVKDDEVVKYLLKDGTGLKIEAEYKNDKGVWIPKQDLPIEFVGKEILTEDRDLDYKRLLKEVEGFIRSYVELPVESDYLYLALWVLHTYLMEKFDVTPLLYFHGVHVTGKTRAGETLAKISFKCERSTAPTEATLFRSASYFKNALVIDEIRLWGSDANQDVQNLIKSRYKRGLKVPRVNLNKEGEEQIEYFDVFAPLVICTTEGLTEIIESRCLLFSMQPNANADVEKRIDEKRAQELRNRLTIFRANEIDKEFKDPSHREVGRRRLGEILTPLYLVLMLTDPGREKEFKSTVKEIERAKAAEEGMSFEAELVRIITECVKEDKQDFVLSRDIKDRLNENTPEKNKVSAMMVSSRTKRLGFERVREATTGKRGFMIKPALLKRLQLRFGVEEYTLTPEEKTQKEFEYPEKDKDNPEKW